MKSNDRGKFLRGETESRRQFARAASERQKKTQCFCSTLAVRHHSIESTAPVMRVEPGEVGLLHRDSNSR